MSIDKVILEGVINGYINEDFPNIVRSNNEELLNQNRNHNASIIIGRDRPAGLNSGYGKLAKDQGGDKSTTIDIVVGRYSLKSGTTTNINGKKITFDRNQIVGNNFQEDASRIYISQKTDIDKNFLIDKAGTLASSIGKAGIGIKSDNVRIIGRETVKIVAKNGEKNSLGEIPSSVDGEKEIYGIQLITGNGTEAEDVQYIGKAKNIENCFRDLIDKIGLLIGTVDAYIKFQQNFNSYVSTHEHDGHFRSDIAGAVKILEPYDLSAAFGKFNADITSATLRDLDSIRKSFDTTRNTYLKPGQKNYIGSLFNKTN